ncbi:MAG: helix-turn-helix domain-containing protein [Myxococcota bacterium]
MRNEASADWPARACELLAGTGRPIGEIATELGFARREAFRRAFVREFGCPPARWRSGARAREADWLPVMALLTACC